MGSFYVNITVQGADQNSIINAIKGRSAYVSPTVNNFTVIFDEQCDSQDQEVISNLSSRLSEDLNCAVFAILNHDDDILWYHLYENGKLIDEYDSSPGYFDETAEPSSPYGGNAEALCNAFNCAKIGEVKHILKKSSYDDEGYVFALDRHEDLIKTLNLPEFCLGYGYYYISEGEIPDGYEKNQFINTIVEKTGGLQSQGDRR